MARISGVETGRENPFARENLTRTKRKVGAYIEAGREVRAMLRPDVGEATVHLDGVDGAVRILVVSDLHAFHEATSLKKVDAIWKEINQPNTFVIFAGDLVEGIKQEYLEDTVSTLLPMQAQIDAFREIWIRPLVEKGKLLAMVTRYGSHDDWPRDKTTLDAVSSLVAGLTLPNGLTVPLIWNGGKLNLHLIESDLTFSLPVFHSVGGRGSTLNPVRPLREVLVAQKVERGRLVPKGVAAGHNHSRAGVSSERVMVGGTEVQLVLLQNGTIKGVDEETPDFFMRRQGATPKMSGAAMVMRVREGRNGGGELHVTPTYGVVRSRYLLEAMDTLDRAEQQNMSLELVERIGVRNGAMRVVFEEGSVKTERVSDSAIKSPLYKEMRWGVETGPLQLPLTVFTVSHARFGSSERYEGHLKEVLEEISRSSYAMLLVLGDMVDLSVPTKPEREKVLGQFAREMAKVAKERRLGVMLSSVMRSDRWNREVKEGKETVSDPVITGDWLYLRSAIKGTPLYEGGASMRLKVGEVDYWWYMLDGTGNFGSRQDPYLALIQLDKLSMVHNEVVTGGISTIPGALTNGDRILLAPGWESPAVDRRYGKAFSLRVPTGGQGVIMFPEVNGEGKIFFGGGSFRETRDMSRALLLWRGLKGMGELEKVVKRKRGKR